MHDPLSIPTSYLMPAGKHWVPMATARHDWISLYIKSLAGGNRISTNYKIEDFADERWFGFCANLMNYYYHEAEEEGVFLGYDRLSNADRMRFITELYSPRVHYNFGQESDAYFLEDTHGYSGLVLFPAYQDAIQELTEALGVDILSELMIEYIESIHRTNLSSDDDVRLPAGRRLQVMLMFLLRENIGKVGDLEDINRSLLLELFNGEEMLEELDVRNAEVLRGEKEWFF